MKKNNRILTFTIVAILMIIVAFLADKFIVQPKIEKANYEMELAAEEKARLKEQKKLKKNNKKSKNNKN